MMVEGGNKMLQEDEKFVCLVQRHSAKQKLELSRRCESKQEKSQRCLFVEVEMVTVARK